VTAPRYAELAAELFAREGRSSHPPPEADARARAISAIAGALAARTRRRRIARWSAGLSAAAAVAAAALGLSHHLARREIVASPSPTRPAPPVQIVAHAVSGATVLSSGAPAPLAEESAVPQGSRLITPANGRATLAFSTGTNVVVGEGADMTLGGDGARQVLRLSTGWIDLHVAKLAADQRFVVGTADAEVEVRGTQFHVSIVRPDPACGHGTPTRVAVTEGVVVVRHDGTEDRVAAGEVWPTGCARGGGVASGPEGRLGPQGIPAAAVGPASTLAEQNDLYARAIAARNAGDVRGALVSFRHFLAKYPGSALAGEAAHAEIMRLLERVSPSQAVGAARQYLAAYPDGPARNEAERIVSDVP
jgi:ferric-dicitrate binding protein FerR (iron transport regulator)